MNRLGPCAAVLLTLMGVLIGNTLVTAAALDTGKATGKAMRKLSK